MKITEAMARAIVAPVSFKRLTPEEEARIHAVVRANHVEYLRALLEFAPTDGRIH